MAREVTEQAKPEDARLMPLIRTSFAASDSTYGAIRVARDLRDWGERCRKRRTGRLMRLALS